ncbi:MAG: phenylacetate--CoA ligase family protein [Chloroflexi bacterium]|nr:phenylacetate--CoA ligase family protein [Chloroflexota bacterium]MBT7081245.1 phenylacetate--CoA ligase family protein [Chloroflexota bacterium]MBT7288920.1 phenylacetate--CoA ligase family protein [Chloroflexota bacterium]
MSQDEHIEETQEQPVDPSPQVDQDAQEVVGATREAAPDIDQKQAKKDAAEGKKAEDNKRKELIGAYETAVKLFVKTRLGRRALRDKYWTDKDWHKREYLAPKNIVGRQKKLFKKQIGYMWKHSPYMRIKMEGEGIIKAKEIKKLEDLERLPFISNADLSGSQSEAPPYGDVCCVASDEVTGVATSDKASAAPRYFITSKRDVANTYRLARPLITAGVRADDVVVVLGNSESFWAFKPLCEVLKVDFGCLVIMVDGTDAKKHMEVITHFKATVLVGTSSQVQALGDTADLLGMDAAHSTVRLLITGGEIGIGSSEEIGKVMQEVWGAKAFEIYGCADVGILAWSCDAQHGLHLMEDDYIFEVIDPKTKQEVSVGAEGELVVTPLLNQTVPVTRYRTQDIVTMLADPCGCRRSVRRIVIKRRLAEEPVELPPVIPEKEHIDPEPTLVGVGAGSSLENLDWEPPSEKGDKKSPANESSDKIE